MATELAQQAGFYDDGKVQWGLDTVTHALVPNPLNSGAVDIGAADALVGAIYSSGGFAGPILKSANGALLTPTILSEEMTLATGATTTDSTANLLPANAIILQVVARVTTTITASATGWSLGDGSTAARFRANDTNLTAGSTGVGMAHLTGTVAFIQAAAAKLRITCAGGNPGAGKVRVSVLALVATAPTS